MLYPIGDAPARPLRTQATAPLRGVQLLAISTGTPAGVSTLAPDRLRGRIEKIGEMELRVTAEGAGS